MAQPINFPVRFLYDPPGVILPPFWKQWPRIYFAGAELAFAKNNVTNSQDKFNYLLNSFTRESLLDIQYELLLAGHSILPYEALKESLISIYGNNEPNCTAIPALAITGARSPAASCGLYTFLYRGQTAAGNILRANPSH